MTPAPLYPPTIIYGHEPPNIRLRWQGGTQTYFCLNNGNLHLTDADFNHQGTYEAGVFLGALCKSYCLPERKSDKQPCPAFVRSWRITKGPGGLASVEPHPVPVWRECGGIKALLALMQTEEERFFLLSYLEDKCGDEAKWRDQLVSDWNEHWSAVRNEWGATSRRGKFEQMVWWTVRFPALIPQVWLNWLYAAPEDVVGVLEDNPSRVDFVAFWDGERHAIEIDGPSHYADFDDLTRTYVINEKAYARNLKIERSLRTEEWVVTRIGRSEVREAMDADPADFFSGFAARSALLGALPFYKNAGYPARLGPRALGVSEIEKAAYAKTDDIPF